MASTTTPTSQVIRLTNVPPTLPNIPANFPLRPTPGKLELLLNANDTYLYHKFTPFTNFHDSILSSVLSNQQPFVYTFVDQANQGLISQLPPTIQNLLDVVSINQDSVSDVVRVSKFLKSSWGVQFLINQSAIQRLAPFDETRTYNPASSLLATVQPLTLGVGDLPTRHIEGGLLGFANAATSTVGINLESGFQTPASTVGSTALPSSNTGQGKGLIRGGDAGKGYTQLQVKWPVSSPQPTPTGISSLTTAMANAAGQMFATTNVKQPDGTQVRADEATYGFMATSYKLALQQQWFPSLNVTISPIGGTAASSPSPLSSLNAFANTNAAITPTQITSQTVLISSLLNPPAGGNNTLKRFKLIALPDGRSMQLAVDNGVVGMTINGNPTGYPIAEGDTYGQEVGRPTDPSDYTNSDMLVQYSYYLNESNNYPTKQSDATKDSVKSINQVLQNVVKNINMGHTYNANTTTISNLLPSGQLNGNLGFNALNAETNPNLNKLQKGTIGEYYSNGGNSNATRPKSIDAFVRPEPDNLRMASAFLSDGINMLGVVQSNKATVGGDGTSINLSNVYPGWTEWKPYDDDLIAFFFYDVVNDKYIPFRATMKGLSEGNTAYWDELRFIGRADQLYSYNGFSRTLSFTFNVVINSVNELLPSWKKINYLASSVKPSNYTAGQNVLNQGFNRFIVPPMFMITIGDLYKFQPVVITSINVNIPDDASWETLNENNSKQGWSYLNGIITAPNLGRNYGQLPREVEIVVTCNLLEKERAIVGGSHFGHEPRVDDWENKTGTDRFLTSGSAVIPFLPVPTTLHQNFVEWNDPGAPQNGNVKPQTVTPAVTGTPTSTAATLNTGKSITPTIPITNNQR